MMNFQEIVSVLENERSCVLRAEAGCDRQCEKCELVRDSREIVQAYTEAIGMIQALEKFYDNFQKKY